MALVLIDAAHLLECGTRHIDTGRRRMRVITCARHYAPMSNTAATVFRAVFAARLAATTWCGASRLWTSLSLLPT